MTAELCRPLSPSTSDYDLIWRQGLHGGSQAKVRSSRLFLHTGDVRTWRQTHRGDHVQMQGEAHHLQAKDRSSLTAAKGTTLVTP